MKHHNILIQFHGMEEKSTPQKLKDYLESLLRYSPSNATCRLHIFKESHGYLCKLTVHSEIRTFSSQSKDEDISSGVKTILRTVKEQIIEWNKNRSSTELIDFTPDLTSVTQLNLQVLTEQDDLKEKKVS